LKDVSKISSSSQVLFSSARAIHPITDPDATPSNEQLSTARQSFSHGLVVVVDGDAAWIASTISTHATEDPKDQVTATLLCVEGTTS
jgi:hypothetical protein